MEYLFGAAILVCMGGLILMPVMIDNKRATGSIFKRRKRGFVEEGCLGKLEYVLELVHQLKHQDNGNFICLNIWSMDDDRGCKFKKANRVRFQVFYAGSRLADAWEQNDPEMDPFKACFSLVREPGEDYCFCTDVELQGTDVVVTLNAALHHNGFVPAAEKRRKLLTYSLKSEEVVL